MIPPENQKHPTHISHKPGVSYLYVSLNHTQEKFDSCLHFNKFKLCPATNILPKTLFFTQENPSVQC